MVGTSHAFCVSLFAPHSLGGPQVPNLPYAISTGTSHAKESYLYIMALQMTLQQPCFLHGVGVFIHLLSSIVLDKKAIAQSSYVL